MRTFFIILLLISSVGAILSTLFMEPKAEGMGSISGSSANVFGKGASRGKEKLLNRLTLIFGIIFAISAIAVTALTPSAEAAEVLPETTPVQTETSAESTQETVEETTVETEAETTDETEAETTAE